MHSRLLLEEGVADRFHVLISIAHNLPLTLLLLELSGEYLTLLLTEQPGVHLTLLLLG